MKNKVFIIWIYILIFLLSACSNKESGTTSLSGNSEKADARFEKILEYIQDDDEIALKDIFSSEVISIDNDLDERIKYLFEFFQGDVVSWTRDTYTFEALKHDGGTSLQLLSWYTVETEQESYMFFLIDYTTDTINPDNEGVYTLRVIKAEDEETEFGYVEDMTIPGIYIPE